MNTRSFFVDALGSALELGIATPDDVLRHVTPDVLASHLPRPLWARLLTACVGAPRVDAQLVVETIGVANLCEHVPEATLWVCIAEIAERALSGAAPSASATSRPVSRATSSSTAYAATQPLAPVGANEPTLPLLGGAQGTLRSMPLVSEPPPAVAASPAAPPSTPPVRGPSIPSLATHPIADVVAELEAEERAPSPPTRARTPTGQRFRSSNTGSGIGRLATNARRPQAQASASIDPPTARPARRGETEGDFEVETSVSAGKDDWKNALAVDDDQLVDWQASEETLTSADDFPRKR